VRINKNRKRRDHDFGCHSTSKYVSVASTTSFHFPGRVSGEWASGALAMGRSAQDQLSSEPSLVSLM
jgi:hypothetical protein